MFTGYYKTRSLKKYRHKLNVNIHIYIRQYTQRTIKYNTIYSRCPDMSYFYAFPALFTHQEGYRPMS